MDHPEEQKPKLNPERLENLVSVSQANTLPRKHQQKPFETLDKTKKKCTRVNNTPWLRDSDKKARSRKAGNPKYGEGTHGQYGQDKETEQPPEAQQSP